MTSTLPPEKRTRLVRLCGMLGSDFDGERANAGRLADNLVRDLDLTWDDVITRVPARQEEPRQKRKQEQQSDPECPRTSREVARYCLDSQVFWSEWETGFLTDMLDRQSLSVRQDEVLGRLFEKAVKARQRRAGQ